jgi:hypothetical protein
VPDFVPLVAHRTRGTSMLRQLLLPLHEARLNRRAALRHAHPVPAVLSRRGAFFQARFWPSAIALLPFWDAAGWVRSIAQMI